MEKFFSDSPEQTAQIGRTIAARLKPGSCVLFKGEMGAGKTHFTKGIAEYFGAGDVVTSPTFALVNEYEGDVPIFHFDLFRIDTVDDLYAIGFFDYLDRGGITVIEWSENIPELTSFLEDYCILKITKTGDSSRTIEYIPGGEPCADTGD